MQLGLHNEFAKQVCCATVFFSSASCSPLPHTPATNILHWHDRVRDNLHANTKHHTFPQAITCPLLHFIIHHFIHSRTHPYTHLMAASHTDTVIYPAALTQASYTPSQNPSGTI